MYDAHDRPPNTIRDLFKDWRKRSLAAIESDQSIIDPYQQNKSKVTLLPPSDLPLKDTLDHQILEFVGATETQALPQLPDNEPTLQSAFAVNTLPGLFVFPSLVSPYLQIALLDKLLHRDLSNPVHKTNLHLHYHIPYADAEGGINPSFFAAEGEQVLHPSDPSVHKSLKYTQMLKTKLRWMTLGGQYDWTNKVYPKEIPPAFPADIAALLKGFFPEVDAQAAIVNFYSPGDTLSVHRDVSEKCEKSLISISMGCDGIFLVGNEDGSEVEAIRLRSGDAILMSGESRYAWHGVPKILPDTCPVWLRDWPDIPRGESYQHWRGWMSSKRINLNVRQMVQ